MHFGHVGQPIRLPLACHLPVQLEHRAYWAIKKMNFDSDQAGA